METKQLVDKFINGEITEAEFDTESSKLSPDDKKVADGLLEAGKKNLLKEITGLRSARKAESEKTNATLETRLQKENLEAAKTKFFKEFGIEKAEDRSAFETGFTTESVNVENIIADMKKKYVAMNPDKYLALEREKRDREVAAEDFNGQNAGANGSSGGSGDNKTIPKEVREYMEASRKAGRTVTAEFAAKALKLAANKGKIPT